MLKNFKADLHVHTCLSPCGDLKMSPQAITKQAKTKDIDILGICDHNSAENTPALIKSAQKHHLWVLPGLEITSQEEVHILALFDDPQPAFELQEIIYQNLPGENDEKAFGLQVVVNEEDEVIRFNQKLLIGASALTVEEVIQTIHSLHGLSIAAHVDKEAFSLLGQLGFIPENLRLDALEISPNTSLDEARKKFKNNYPITCSSDAHYPHDIGKGYTSFFLKECTVAEIKKALKNEEGRKLIH